MAPRKKQTPKTWRRADDLACGKPTGAITRDPITEPKHSGQGVGCPRQIVDKRAATSQVPEVTAVGYNACPRIPPGRLRAEPDGAKQVCNHVKNDAKSRRGHFFSDVEVFALTASSTSLRTPSGVRSFGPISRLLTNSVGAVLTPSDLART